MLAGLWRALGSDTRSRAGSALFLGGAVLLLYSLGSYLELTPGSQVVLPDPPALSRAHGLGTTSAALGPGTSVPARSQPAPTPVVAAIARPTADRSLGRKSADSLTPTAPASPSPTPRPVLASWTPARPVPLTVDPASSGAEERFALASLARPGIPVWLRIPSIDLETQVVEAGTTRDRQGNLVWETVPFVAAYYTPTAPVGGQGNAVIAGHVVTLNEGNVFRNLYRVNYGDRVEVSTLETTFTYEVVEIALVDPSRVEVMAPTADARLTLITCGGRFDRRTRSFDKRLVVVARILDS